MRYYQPEGWHPNARYSEYLKDQVLREQDVREYDAIKKEFMKIPKLGANGADELILKLASYLNEKG